MLHGVRVLDLSRVLAAPHAAMTLGDLGADVIKVERPGSGDESRGWGPPFSPDGESAYFLSTNRNKLSIALDLDVERDREMVLYLIRSADVVIDNFLPGVLGRRGLDPPTLVAELDRLVWCTLTGFDDRADRPGYDFVVQAESGWMSITGEPGGRPMKAGIALADILAGKDAVIGILAVLTALRAGSLLDSASRRIVISLQRSASAALMNVAQNYLVSGTAPARWGNAHANLVPYQLFDAQDRPFVLAVGNDDQWRRCCIALAIETLAADPNLATNAGRLEHRERVISAIAARVAARPAVAWIAALENAGVPCGMVRDVPEVLEAAGASARTGMPPSVPGTVRLPPPRLDEHGGLIRALGWEAFSRLQPT